MFLRRARWLLGLWPLACVGCGSDERPGRYHAVEVVLEGGIEVDGAATDGPPDPDAAGLCGNQIIPTLEDRPNLYFVLDRSGSMNELLPDSSLNKYMGARDAVVRLLRTIGHRVRYGAAAFPSRAGQDECAIGSEVFATRGGDPLSYAERGEDGPALQLLLATLGLEAPGDYGGTPTAGTLQGLVPVVGALEGTTFVVLATDGAPNCNAAAHCGAEDCSLNVAGLILNGISCNAAFNCCDPQLFSGAQLSCVDGAASVAAIGALTELGVKTYVIGMPGSQYYASLLDQMAEAGGTARADTPRYVPVTNLADLSQAVMDIGVRVAISCKIVPESAPPDITRVNVYFDRDLVPSDPVAGWVFDVDGAIQINGTACDRLMSGKVLQVQVVSGCATVVY